MLWIERFDTLDDLRTRIREFAEDFDEHWLLQRHGYRIPRQTRTRDASGHHGMITAFTNQCPVNRVRRDLSRNRLKPGARSAPVA